VIGRERNLKQGKVELKFRITGERRVITIEDGVGDVRKFLEN